MPCCSICEFIERDGSCESKGTVEDGHKCYSVCLKPNGAAEGCGPSNSGFDSHQTPQISFP